MSPGEPPGNGDAMEQLRELLVGPERKDLADLRRRVTEPGEKTEELSRILASAVRISSSRDQQLSQALAPTVESALKESVKKDPRILTDVVFPIIGPAIRRAMADAFSKMLQSLNQTLEHSVSLQGLKWRIEAARTGKSFAEVVIARTLIYRVEQVFLIHKETGLLLEHVQAANATAQDADMVSGMLTAIQDFMRDAFKAEGDGLRSTEYGDYNVWVESSRQLTLAAFVRGIAPEEYRATLEVALERISKEQHVALTNFSGDAAPFAAARPALEDCLHEQRAESSGKLSPMLWIVPLLLFAAGILWWNFAADLAIRRKADEMGKLVVYERRRHTAHLAIREEQRKAAQLSNYTQRLNEEEGIVVTESARRDGRNFIAGLRDPLAADPQSFLADAGIAPNTLTARWEAYYALTPGLVLKRATQRLSPPASAKLEMRGDTLAVTGSASGAWVEAAKKRVETIPGIAGFDTSGVLDVGMLALAAKKKAIDETVIFFGEGIEIVPGQEAALKQLALQITDLRDAAKNLGRRLRVTVTGHTTEVGTDDFNMKLSRNRADRAMTQLALYGVDATALVPVGFAAREQKFRGATEEDAKNRRVTFTASYDESAPTP